MDKEFKLTNHFENLTLEEQCKVFERLASQHYQNREGLFKHLIECKNALDKTDNENIKKLFDTFSSYLDILMEQQAKSLRFMFILSERMVKIESLFYEHLEH